MRDTSLAAVDILVGRRSLDQDCWTPIEDQVAFAFQAALQSQGSVVGSDLSLFGAEGDADHTPVSAFPGFAF